MTERIAFIGGGNMASALISGLLNQGTPTADILVIEPAPSARERLLERFGLSAIAAADTRLAQAGTVIWAVKPQVFRDVATGLGHLNPAALHLSVAAGIRSDSIASWLGSERIIRAMPNTPALIAQGICGLFARAGASLADRERVGALMRSTGQILWFEDEEQLDVVTALSGSGPAYVFYLMEAMIAAGTDMGMSQEQASSLVIETFVGASLLARQSSESPQVLREQVTSKGGTTHAAITTLEQADVKAWVVKAVVAARQRAHELGVSFGES